MKQVCLFPSENVETLREALEKLLNDAPIRKQMGEASRRRVEENYSWDSTATAIRAFIGTGKIAPMCGICGISYSDNQTPEKSLLQKMTQAIVHRGPDSDGFYTSAGIGLGMRRLAIIDVAGGDQPIPNEDESLWIIFNGELHNFPELYTDLVKRGHEFRTRTDSECILHLYEEYGDECVQHLRGQAAFALWDSKKQKLLLARDRMGKKPSVLHNSKQYALLCI